MNADYSKWPPYTRLPPDAVQRYAQLTLNGQYDLTDAEQDWRNLSPVLERRGYSLRPRYEESWTPSWTGTNISPLFCEDSIRPIVPHVIDATRTDGLLVSIKRVSSTSKEVEIGQFLSELQWNPMNHCVPILDVFPDFISQDTSYIVMPYLRPFDDPEFIFLGEVVDFIGQTLQGLSFMHKHRVAHRDCTGLNIMMDGAALYPDGFHPIRINYSRDGVFELDPLARIENPVRYYFIDFGMSTRFATGASPYVVGAKGRDQDVPELSHDVPYNAYKVDIYILGNLYHKEFFEKYQGMDFLVPLIDAMTKKDPAHRPFAAGALSLFRCIHNSLDSELIHLRLRRRNESVSERIVRDTFAAAKEGISTLKRFVGQ